MLKGWSVRCQIKYISRWSVGLIGKVKTEQSHKVSETVQCRKGKSPTLGTYIALSRNSKETSVSTLPHKYLTSLYCNSFFLNLFDD